MKYEVTLVVEAPADYSAYEVKQMILAGVCHCKKVVVWNSKSKKL